MRSKNVMYNIITNLLLQVVIIVYGFIVPKIVISNYGSNVNGLISSITQFLAYISLLDSGFTAVIKSQLYKPIADNDNRKINSILKSSDLFFKRIAYIFIIYIILLAIYYPLIINNTFEYAFTSGLVIILSISMLAEYYFGMVYKVYLQAEQKSYIISLIQIITYLFVIISTILLSKIGVSVLILKLVSSLFFIIRPLFQNLYVRKKYNISLKNVEEKYIIKNKWDGFAQHIAAVIHGGTDITVLTIFSSLISVSIYSVYSLVTSGIRKIIQSFTGGVDASFGDMIAKKEIDNLNDKFEVYETLYNTITTIFYSCTLILIVPFIMVYTKGISDTNYVNWAFGILLVVGEYIWALRQPYNELIKAAGRFKETKLGAWIECVSNIIISVILVIKYGLIGVAIGTIFAMLIRALDFIYQTNKYILKRKQFISIKKIIIAILETLIIVLLAKHINFNHELGYVYWITDAFKVFALSLVITLLLNYIFFKEELKKLLVIIKRILKRRNHNHDYKNI